LNENEKIVEVSAGFNHAMAVTSLGRVFVWGGNNQGQLGTNNTTNYSYPIEITANFVLSEGEKVISVKAGDYVSYAITSLGRLFAWGSNSDYKIGDGTMINRYLPKDITPKFFLDFEEQISEVHPGNRCALAVTSNGRIFTWGYDGYIGILARGEMYASSLPYDVTANFNFGVGETISELSFGKYDGVIITSEGRIIT
jgi:alpha-tubulin suppressor-like RCC1 family protein